VGHLCHIHAIRFTKTFLCPYALKSFLLKFMEINYKIYLLFKLFSFHIHKLKFVKLSYIVYISEGCIFCNNSVLQFLYIQKYKKTEWTLLSYL